MIRMKRAFDTTWNIEDTTFSPIQNLQERRNIYRNTTDNRRENTDNREEQRRPKGGNDIIIQFWRLIESTYKEIREFKKKDYEDEYIIVNKLPDDDELVEYWHIFQEYDTLCL
ncbi:8689_t:CDS:2, partial [Funneliformis mosseae]